MSSKPFEEYTNVIFCTTIASIAAPTVAEIAAGDDLTTFITKDGLTTPSNQNMVDSATISTRFDAQRVGSYGGPINLTMKRDDDDAVDPFELLAWGDEGFMVIRRLVPYATSFAAGQRVEVYPVEAHNPIMAGSAANEEQRFSQQFAVTSTPNEHGVVAA